MSWRTHARFVAFTMALAGCGTPPEPAPEVDAPRAARDSVPREPSLTSPSRFEQVGRDTYLYRLHSLRAEETAETLRALFDGDPDREFIIVPHRETNSLLIKILPRRQNDDGRRFNLR